MLGSYRIISNGYRIIPEGESKTPCPVYRGAFLTGLGLQSGMRYDGLNRGARRKRRC